MSKQLVLEKRIKSYQEKAKQAKKDLEALKERNAICNLCKKPYGATGYCKTVSGEKYCHPCYDNLCPCGKLQTDKRIYCQDVGSLRMRSFCAIECSSYHEAFNKGFILLDAYSKL
jgi:hypothetical protein